MGVTLSNRTEWDRLQKVGLLRQLTRHPELDSFLVMGIAIVAIAIARRGQAFNALGLKNDFAAMAQLGIIAIGACLLMIAGEFDISIGSMVGFAGMVTAVLLKYGR
jgi:simple sugar transport system permease protein